MKTILFFLSVSSCLAGDIVERYARDTNCTLTITETGLAKVSVPCLSGTNIFPSEFTFKPGQELEIKQLITTFQIDAFHFEKKNIRPMHRVIGVSKNNESSLIFSVVVPNSGPALMLVEEKFHGEDNSKLKCSMDDPQTMKVWNLLSQSRYLSDRRNGKGQPR